MKKIGFYQFNPEFGEVKRNLIKVTNMLDRADADIIVLPELAFTGYFFKDRNQLESFSEDPDNSSTVDTLTTLCKKKKFYLVTGFAEKSSDKIFNSALLIGPGGLIHTYRKVHLFNTEKLYFDKGDKPFQINEVRGIKIGMMICFDWFFPEVTRTLAIQGADVICHPSNLVLSYCQQTMIGRSIENFIYIVTANRYGIEKHPHGKFNFTGQSQIVAPKGNLIHRSPSDMDDLFVTEIDLSLSREKKITKYNHLFEDRRPEFY